ncbi:CLUMA_CG014852, isoform A [Clunio marinus]|uniref:CLUMA_CG014852, isoform A n=1 Tax=Clunio marinus TaxID=568069 RepID=A0A1J1IM32_9DIPT|nr:CLUMA_CG014852, isoform A [Clunio marinus]
MPRSGEYYFSDELMIFINGFENYLESNLIAIGHDSSKEDLVVRVASVPLKLTCPECKFKVITKVQHQTSMLTHAIAAMLVP